MISDVAVGGGQLKLIVGNAGIADTQEETAFDTHYCRYEFAEFIDVHNPLYGNVGNAVELGGVGAVVERAVVSGNVGNDIYKCGTTYDYEMCALAFKYLYRRAYNSHGQYVYKVSVERCEILYSYHDIVALYGSGDDSGGRLGEFIILCGEH